MGWDVPTRCQNVRGWSPGLLSGLALAGANRGKEQMAADRASGEDVDTGILTAKEIGTLNLDGVDLVVLSACETGLGQAAGGEGLLGLQRAFQSAGRGTSWPACGRCPTAKRGS